MEKRAVLVRAESGDAIIKDHYNLNVLDSYRTFPNTLNTMAVIPAVNALREVAVRLGVLTIGVY